MSGLPLIPALRATVALGMAEAAWSQAEVLRQAGARDLADACEQFAVTMEGAASAALPVPDWKPTRKPTRKEAAAMTDSPTPRNLAAVAMQAAARDPTARHRRERADLDMPPTPRRLDPSRIAETALGYRMLDITLPRRRPLWKRLLRVA